MTAYASFAAGRVHISEAQRLALVTRMDEALAAENLDSKYMGFELERHLPGINFHVLNQDKEDRLFSKTRRAAHAHDFQRARLASPSHSRLYFTLVEPADSITNMDITELVEAAHKGVNAVAGLMLRLSEQRGDTGATKAERLLDHLIEIDNDTIQGWPVESVVMGLVNISDELATDETGDIWGYSRIWHLARRLLKRLSDVLPKQRWNTLVETVFAGGESLGFVSHLLRSETFSHGFYGERSNSSEAITSQEVFEQVRIIMLQRYSNHGLDKIIDERQAITILYAWSQAGGRDQVVRAVAERTQNDQPFIEFMLKICSTSVSSEDAYLSLSLDAIYNFFASPPEIVRRVSSLEHRNPTFLGAGLVLEAIARDPRFNGLELEQIVEHWRAPNE